MTPVLRSRGNQLLKAEHARTYQAEIELLKNEPDIFLLLAVIRTAPEPLISKAWLAEKMGVSTREVRRKLIRARALGVLVIHPRRGKSNVLVPSDPDKLRVANSSESLGPFELPPGGRADASSGSIPVVENSTPMTCTSISGIENKGVTPANGTCASHVVENSTPMTCASHVKSTQPQSPAALKGENRAASLMDNGPMDPLVRTTETTTTATEETKDANVTKNVTNGVQRHLFPSMPSVTTIPAEDGTEDGEEETPSKKQCPSRARAKKKNPVGGAAAVVRFLAALKRVWPDEPDQKVTGREGKHAKDLLAEWGEEFYGKACDFFCANWEALKARFRWADWRPSLQLLFAWKRAVEGVVRGGCIDSRPAAGVNRWRPAPANERFGD